MKSFKRRALAFVVTTAMVLTSLVVPAFAASNEIDVTGLTAAEDGKSYYSGTLKYEYAGGTVDLAALPSGSGYDASYNDITTKAILFLTAQQEWDIGFKRLLRQMLRLTPLEWPQSPL